MGKQHQIKISVSEKLEKIIAEKANKIGVKKASYCYNILFEHLRKEMEKSDGK